MKKQNDPATDPRIKERRFKDYLRCDLTEDELREQARTMADKTAEVDSLESGKKAMAAEFKSKIERAQASMNEASRLYRQGWEMRHIDCVERMVPATGSVEYVRMDTGEVYKTRKMTQDELWGKLPADMEDAENVEIDVTADHEPVEQPEPALAEG